MVKALIMMADYGHDPTETAVPYTAFREAGFKVSFATEKGVSPLCDARMLEGITSLATSRSVKLKYASMIASHEWKNALSWSAAGFDLHAFNLVFFPGGQDHSIRQLLDSEVVHKLLQEYFQTTRKPSANVIGAICHGVKVLADTNTDCGRSVLHGCITAVLPSLFEQAAFRLLRPFMDGDYCKVYGGDSEDLEHAVGSRVSLSALQNAKKSSQVQKKLEQKTHLKTSWSPLPFVVEDDQFNYVSGRCQADAQKLSERLVFAVQRKAQNEPENLGSE
ncbi:hypothetical protein ARSEF1564_009237 [Beauveria bassiana]